MSLLSNLMPVVLLLIVHCRSWSLASRLGPHKNCLTCKDGHSSGVGRASRDHTGAASTTVLALGEPCGVYTLSCAKGLRCVPLPREQSPLQSLLQGRGFCAKQSKFSPTDRPRPTGPHPSHSGEIEKAPCRKLLNTVLRGLELTIFQSDRDIYIPNCDTRGFYRKKQVCSVEIAGVSTSWATLCRHVLGKKAFYHVMESEGSDGSTALSLEEEDEEEYRERG